MKKLLSALLLCCLVASMFGALTASAEEPYHITMAYVGNEQPDMDKVVAAINELTLAELNMTFDVIQLGWGEYQQRQQLMLSGGDDLDILSVFFQQAIGYINNGYLVNQADYIYEYGKGIIDFMGEDVATGGAVNGFIYGTPANKESASLSGIVMRNKTYQPTMDAVEREKKQKGWREAVARAKM